MPEPRPRGRKPGRPRGPSPISSVPRGPRTRSLAWACIGPAAALLFGEGLLPRRGRAEACREDRRPRSTRALQSPLRPRCQGLGQKPPLSALPQTPSGHTRVSCPPSRGPLTHCQMSPRDGRGRPCAQPCCWSRGGPLVLVQIVPEQSAAARRRVAPGCALLRRVAARGLFLVLLVPLSALPPSAVASSVLPQLHRRRLRRGARPAALARRRDADDFGVGSENVSSLLGLLTVPRWRPTSRDPVRPWKDGGSLCPGSAKTPPRETLRSLQALPSCLDAPPGPGLRQKSEEPALSAWEWARWPAAPVPEAACSLGTEARCACFCPWESPCWPASAGPPGARGGAAPAGYSGPSLSWLK